MGRASGHHSAHLRTWTLERPGHGRQHSTQRSYQCYAAARSLTGWLAGWLCVVCLCVQVLCGDFALSLYECRVQFALWSLWSAPLYLSVDLRQLDPEMKAILLNKEVIAIDQDALGQQGLRVATSGCDSGGHRCQQSVWKKNLSNGDVAVVMYNRESSGMPVQISATWDVLGLPSGNYKVRDLWQGADVGVYNSSFTANVNTHDALIFRLSAAKSDTTSHQPANMWRHQQRAGRQ